MDVTFFGAAGGVTGSCMRLRVGGASVLFDCGLFQGRRAATRRANERFGFDAGKVAAVVQSHAHIDHSGRLPLLVRQGFAGAIHATPGTRDLAQLLLLDSAHIQMKDAEFLNKQRAREKLRKKRARPARHADEDEPEFLRPQRLPRGEVLPLYLAEDALDTLELFVDQPYGAWFDVVPGLRCRFHDAGHILGSAWVEVELSEAGRGLRLVFTGDYGRPQPILRDPAPLLPADVFVSESTYGDRAHPPMEDVEGALEAAVARLEQRGRGRLLIPSFAVGRAQTILYFLNRILRRRGSRLEVVVDSPLATAATRALARHPEVFDREALAELERARGDGGGMRLRFTESVDESKALNRDPRPLVILSASGMLESGRILHHLKWSLPSPDAEVLIVGYQARHTLGRRLLDGAREAPVLGRILPVRARIEAVMGFSAHADREELLAALLPHAREGARVFLVHGEDDQRKPLARRLRSGGFGAVELPRERVAYEL